MKRIDIESPKTPVVISKSDFEADRARGYATLEFAPAGKLVIKNPRNPSAQIERDVPAVISFRCMQCQFDVVDQDYRPGVSGERRTGMDIMKEHIVKGDHPWHYTPFENPYGNVEDVKIQGIEDYHKEIVNG